MHLFSPDRVNSLRWRLLAAICAVVLLIWLLTGWFSYTKAQHEAEELMDGSLAQTARLLLAITHDNEDDLAELVARLETVRGAEDNIYEPPLEFQIGLGDGSVVARSPDAPELPILGVADYNDIIRHDQAWRVLNAVSDDGRYRVQVAQAIGLRLEDAGLDGRVHSHCVRRSTRLRSSDSSSLASCSTGPRWPWDGSLKDSGSSNGSPSPTKALVRW